MNDSHSTNVSWGLYPRDPRRTSGRVISIGVDDQTFDPKRDASLLSCPHSMDELRIDYCGFVIFGGRRWMHIIGASDMPITEYTTVVGQRFFRLIGFYPGDTASRLNVQTILLRARILEPPDSALPAAGVCPLLTGKVASFGLNIDTPAPRCARVSPSQLLRVVNYTRARATFRFGGSKYSLEPGEGFTVGRPFGSLWLAGVHVLHTSLYDGSGPEIWLTAST
jgi:hypothetical protein